MKHLLLILFLFAGAATNTNEYVYICTGNYSKCYHKTDKCEGLKYCGKEIKKVTIQQAKELGRKPCKFCYGSKND